MDTWLLTGGFARLVVYRTDTGEAISTPDCAPVGGFEATVETRQLSDGTLDVAARTFPLDVLVCDLASVETLRRWRAELDAGADVRVRARLLASGSGPHLVWDEPVPPVISAVAGGRGGLSGERLTLHSGLYAPDVVQSPDLAALVDGGRHVPFGGDAGDAGGGGWAAENVAWADAGQQPPGGLANMGLATSSPSSLSRDVTLPSSAIAPGGLAASHAVRPPRVWFTAETLDVLGAAPTLHIRPLSYTEVTLASPSPTTFPEASAVSQTEGSWPRSSVSIRLPKGAFGVRMRLTLASGEALVRAPMLTTINPVTRSLRA